MFSCNFALDRWYWKHFRPKYWDPLSPRCHWNRQNGEWASTLLLVYPCSKRDIDWGSLVRLGIIKILLKIYLVPLASLERSKEYNTIKTRVFHVSIKCQPFWGWRVRQLWLGGYAGEPGRRTQSVNVASCSDNNRAKTKLSASYFIPVGRRLLIIPPNFDKAGMQ